MKKLIIDVDEVICKEVILKEFNKYFNTNYTMDYFTTYYIEDIIEDERIKKEWYNYILNLDLYKDAQIIEGAYESIKLLNENYDIYICSSFVMKPILNRSGVLVKNKFDWLVNIFPFLNPDKFIFTSAKNVLKCDIMVDDKMSNLQGDIDKKLLFTSYHNKNMTDEELKENKIIRVDNWDDIKEILLKI